LVRTTSPNTPTASEHQTTNFISHNTAGFDFGCGNSQGNYNPSGVTPPLSNINGINGIGQMQHFANDLKLNVFRLPVCWQYLVNNTPGGNLDEGKFAIYNQLVNGCLATGAYCVVDIHNYARWGGQIVGQGGSVTNGHLASVWYQL
jgi:endoglucanase